MIKINAIGENCPIPVIKAKKALKEENVNSIIINVDNKIATENLTKLADKLNCKITINKIDDNNFEVEISKEEYNKNPQNPENYENIVTKNEITNNMNRNINNNQNSNNNIVVMICTEFFGEGDKELGAALMKSYIYSLTEIEDDEIMPKTLIFCNSGAKIPIEESDHLENLQILQNYGVEILTCGACLNFYKLSEKLAIGTTTNMYNINELLLNASKVIKI